MTAEKRQEGIFLKPAVFPDHTGTFSPQTEFPVDSKMPSQAREDLGEGHCTWSNHSPGGWKERGCSVTSTLLAQGHSAFSWEVVLLFKLIVLLLLSSVLSPGGTGQVGQRRLPSGTCFIASSAGWGHQH